MLSSVNQTINTTLSKHWAHLIKQPEQWTMFVSLLTSLRLWVDENWCEIIINHLINASEYTIAVTVRGFTQDRECSPESKSSFVLNLKTEIRIKQITINTNCANPTYLCTLYSYSVYLPNCYICHAWTLVYYCIYYLSILQSIRFWVWDLSELCM